MSFLYLVYDPDIYRNWAEGLIVIFFLMNTLSRWDLLPFYCRCTVRPELGSLDTIPCRWLITLSRRCKNPIQWNPFKLLNHVHRTKYMLFRCSYTFHVAMYLSFFLNVYACMYWFLVYIKGYVVFQILNICF